MDRDYIQLCAEMAYNEVIFENVINEDVLQEMKRKIPFKTRIINFFNALKTFVTNLFNKVIDFLKNTIQKIKNKFSKDNKTEEKETKNDSSNNKDFDDLDKRSSKMQNRFKQKGEELRKGAKQESYYDQLMGMLILEDSNFGSDILKFYTDSKEDIDKKIADVNSTYSRLSQKLSTLEKEYQRNLSLENSKANIDWARRKYANNCEETLKEFKSYTVYKWPVIDEIEKAAQKIGSSGITDKISSSMIDVLNNSIESAKRELALQIKFIDMDIKQFESIYRNSWDNDETGEDDLAYGVQYWASTSKNMSSELVKFLNKAEACYVKITSILLKFI